jgi:cell division protein YceG involved in septum cleavage
MPTPTLTTKPESSVIKATIVVERGNTAWMVCEKIEKAGILKDGNKLVEYMVSHELADYINIGTYTLSSDMSLKEISGILTGR